MGTKGVVLLMVFAALLCGCSFTRDSAPLPYDRYSSERDSIAFQYQNATFKNVFYNVTYEIKINSKDFKLPGINPPEETIIEQTVVLNFDKNANESAYAVRNVPIDYREGTNYKIAFYWAADTATKGNVSWCVKMEKLRVGLLIEDSLAESCVLSESTGYHNITKSALLSINSTGLKNDGITSFSVFRGATDPKDNLNSDAILLTATIYYNAYRLGDDYV